MPSSLPFFSLIVNKSPRTWQGWNISDKPFITGISANFASSTISLWKKTLAIIPSRYLDRTLAVSAIVSPLFNCNSFEERYIAWPPSSYIATSNDTLVLVEGFSNISPNFFPARTGEFSPILDLIFKVSPDFKNSSISSFVKS